MSPSRPFLGQVQMVVLKSAAVLQVLSWTSLGSVVFQRPIDEGRTSDTATLQGSMDDSWN